LVDKEFEMNVLIYGLQSKLKELVDKLQNIHGISIHFAFNVQEFKVVTTNVHPNIIFVNRNAESSLKNDFVENRNGSIYIVDESSSKLNITKFQTRKKISLKKILKEIN